jgi:hypothetical protein
MRPLRMIGILGVALLLAVSLLSADDPARVVQNRGQIPLAFTQNNGQWDERVLFRADAGLATVWITKEGIYYQFTRRLSTFGEGHPDDMTIGANGRSPVPDDRFGLGKNSVETMVLKASFVGVNIDPSAAGEEVMEYKCNYFLGNDPAKWQTDVPNYRAAVLKEVYPGIDMRYFGNGDGRLEYEFIVSPGADPAQIAMRYDGAKSVSVNDAGELVVGTGWNTVVEQRPVIYQIDGDTRCAISGAYTLRGDNTFGFTLDDSYDPTLALVIDPALVYSTYLGGGGEDRGSSIAVDGLGCAYVAGMTTASDFPTQNPYDGSFNGGDVDVFVTKLTASGGALVYSTYLGGSDYDFNRINGIAVDTAGCVYLTGETWSSDFPTQNPYDSCHNGIYEDAFIVKLSASGNALVYSTYFGGSFLEWGLGIAVDAAGCAYVTGVTGSWSDFPLQNPYDGSHNGSEEAFVAKLSASGNELVYSTYLGGETYDQGRVVVVDDSGCVYVTGYTGSSDFPTLNAYDSILNGNFNAFVVKLSASGNELVYGTFLGGSVWEVGLGLAVDIAGCAYVTGWTVSPDFPTLNPYDGSHNGGWSDVFVTKLSPAGNALMYSTYLGGGGYDEARSIAIDRTGCAYLTGKTTSADFPTPNPCGGSLRGPSDAFATKLSASGSALEYSIYLGGAGDDEGISITVDTAGCAYLTGWTNSTDFPTQNPYDGGFNGGTSDAFVAKLSPMPEHVCGDANGDCVVNLLDGVYLINYVFKSGAAPDPLCVGDANGDDGTNVGDAIYFINYVFKGGPAPVATCCP